MRGQSLFNSPQRWNSHYNPQPFTLPTHTHTPTPLACIEPGRAHCKEMGTDVAGRQMQIRTVDSIFGVLTPFPRQSRRSRWACLCPRFLSPERVTIPKLEHYQLSSSLCTHRPFLAEAHLSAECLHTGVRSQALDSQLEHVTPAATQAHGHWPGRLDLSWHREELRLCV